MYAHQVIEDCLSLCSEAYKLNEHIDSEAFKRHCSSYAKLLRQSACFHMGNLDNVFDQFPHYRGTSINTPLSEKSPYSLMWLDGLTKKVGGSKGRKEGALVIALESKGYAMVSCATTDTHSAWVPNPLWHYFTLGNKPLNKNQVFKNDLHEGLGVNLGDTPNNEDTYCATVQIAAASKAVASNAYALDAPVLTLVRIFFDLLTCKNIDTIDNEPPVKLNKSRVKKGKQPLFTYKTLVIKPTSKRQQSLEAQGLWENRIHLCRGHFKEYTPEKPLFGKFTGRYWWQPSVRGRNRNGVVMKDYEVRT